MKDHELNKSTTGMLTSQCIPKIDGSKTNFRPGLI